ncbi:hypothetical protein HK105_209324 [Polyrhizophydium stewartii]|uniref:Uncharacterized protein n=1 Tax=Polyrhizophydium stewartii TaxID=2732419 RepID=A0ABR4MVD1_9FUNG
MLQLPEAADAEHLGHAVPYPRGVRARLDLVAHRRHEQVLDTCATTVTDTAKWSTCLTPIDHTPFIAVGSGAKTNNLFIVENTATNKLRAGPSYRPAADSLVLRSAFSLPSPIHAISTIGDMMVTAGPDGVAQVYKLEPSELGQKGKGVTHVHECVIGESKVAATLSPPGVKIHSVRIKSIELEPTAASASSVHAQTGSGSGAAGASAGVNASAGAAPPVRRLAAVQDKRMYLYDMPTSKVVGVEQVGSDHLNCVTFSPHAPFGALAAVGGLDRTLYLVDTRAMRSRTAAEAASVGGMVLATEGVWRARDAHGLPVLDIKFNPFVPYWVATSGGEGVVKVWDIRFAAGPAACVYGHFDGVNAIAWSNTHCDLIASVSSDRAWRAWSLHHDQLTCSKPSGDIFIGFPGSEMSVSRSGGGSDATDIAIGAKIVGEHQTGYTAPVIAVVASPRHADTFVALSASGEIMSHTIRDELFEQLAPHRYDDLSACDVETKVYARNMSEAFQSLVHCTRTERLPGEMTVRHERELINLVSFRAAVSPEDADARSAAAATEKEDAEESASAGVGKDAAAGKSASGDDDVVPWIKGAASKTNTRDMVLAFRRDLETYGYGLPPRYADFTQWTEMIDNWTQLQLDLVILRFNIVDEVQRGNWRAIVDKEKKLYTGLEADPEFLDRDTIQMFTESVITNAFMKGLSMGLRFGEIVADTPKSRFDLLAPVMALLLFPTVFDSVEWLPDAEKVLARQPLATRQARLAEYVAKTRAMRAAAYDAAAAAAAAASPKLSAAAGGKAAAGAATAGSTKSAAPPQTTSQTASTGSSAASRTLSASTAGSPAKRADSAQTGHARGASKIAETFAEACERKQQQIIKLASEAKEILPMVSLEIRICKLIEKQSDTIDEEIVQAMQQNVMTDSGVSGVRGRGGTISTSVGMAGGPAVVPFERTLSATVNKLYVDALLATGRFEDFFGAGFDLIASLGGTDFSRMLFKLIEGEGMAKLKQHIDALFTTATNHLQSIFQGGGSGAPAQATSTNAAAAATVSKGIMQGSKLVRDAMIVLVKVAAHIMQGQELLKADKSQLDSLMRMMSQLTTTMLQLSAMMQRSFEHLDKAAGKGNSSSREWAQTVHDSLRDAARTFPLSANKARPTQSSEKAATGHTIHEEIFSILDKLYRGFIKPDGQAAP